MGIQLPDSASGYSGQKMRYSYRMQGSSEWEPLGDYDVLTRKASIRSRSIRS